MAVAVPSPTAWLAIIARSGKYRSETPSPQASRFSWVFLVAYALFIISIFPINAAGRLTFLYNDTPIEGERILRHGAALVALFYYLLTFRERSVWEHVIFAACLVGARLCTLASTQSAFFFFVLIVGCAKGVDFEKVVRVYLVTIVALILVYWALSLTGGIPSYDYVTQNGVRHSFGSVYPTDFAAHLFYLSLAILYLRRHALGFADVCLDLILAWFCYTQCIARSATICLLLVAAATVLVVVRERRSGQPFALPPTGLGALVAVCILSCVFVLAFSYRYDPGNAAMARLNGWLSGRLALGRLAFERLRVLPFGQQLRMVGLGSYTNPSDYGGYFYLDSWYMQALMRWGVFCLVVCMSACVLVCLRSCLLNDPVIALLVALMCVHCITDQYLTNYCYDFLLLALTANIGKRMPSQPTAQQSHLGSRHDQRLG